MDDKCHIHNPYSNPGNISPYAVKLSHQSASPAGAFMDYSHACYTVICCYPVSRQISWSKLNPGATQWTARLSVIT